jgi:hypothetical protein
MDGDRLPIAAGYQTGLRHRRGADKPHIPADLKTGIFELVLESRLCDKSGIKFSFCRHPD